MGKGLKLDSLLRISQYYRMTTLDGSRPHPGSMVDQTFRFRFFKALLFVTGRQLIGPMILPGFMMLSGSIAFLMARISDIASPCSS
jgi:hypothetical protein